LLYLWGSGPKPADGASSTEILEELIKTLFKFFNDRILVKLNILILLWNSALVEISMKYTAVNNNLSPERFDAIVFDLDGVITRTAKVHAVAWKTMFDDYLAQRTPASEPYTPFDVETDYRQYVDGKPRYEGVRGFLEARGIDLPYGSPDDPPGRETVCGLGNRKNALFLEELRMNGVEVYASSLALIRTLREAGFRTAVVSSSRNCQAVLEAANIADLFDARVDGRDLQRLDLAGKPAPDMFIEASHQLDSDPQRTVGVEDATSGVQAIRAAGFGKVIGVNRGDWAEALREHGADLVVADLSELQVTTGVEGPVSAKRLPSALDVLDEISPGDQQELALFLDYDGTLTPIVDHPDDAVLSEAMRATVQRLSRLFALAIISGRDLADVRERVGIEGLWYAGSHGFDLAGPEGERMEYPPGAEYLPMLDAAEQSLRDKQTTVPGCLVERKRFSIAIHYRQVADDAIGTVQHMAETTQTEHPGLRLSTGKKIFELQPDIDWNKGKALRWLMKTLDMDATRFIPLYIGDDVTDEDAFRELDAGGGIGILVAPADQPTRAAYRLDDPDAVELFLNRLGDALERSRQ
jgi:trehalose 6-phosphate phosphatase